LRYLAILSGCLLLSACAKVTFVQPTSGPMAEITLRTNAANLNIGVVSYRGDEYLESKGDSVGILNSKVLGYPFTNEISFMVVAGTEFRFSTKIGGGIRNPDDGGMTLVPSICQTHAAFVPEDGARYLVEHSAPGGYCMVVVHQLMPDGQMRDVEVARLRSCLDPQMTGGGFAEHLCPEGFDFRN